jgi:hypothetical protein
VLSYNSLPKEYLFNVLCKNKTNKTILIEFVIKNLPTPFLKTITVHQPIPDTEQLNPPFIDQSLYIQLDINSLEFTDALNFQCFAQNGPVIFEPVDLPPWVRLSSSGLFTGTPPLKTDRYHAQFKVTNSIGPTFYNLTIDVNFTLLLTFYYLYTEGYDVLDGDGYLVQEDHNPDNEIFSRIIYAALPASPS